MSSARSAQTLRGLAAAAFSTFVALFSHIAGGGEMPRIIGVTVPLVLSAFICVLLAGRRLSLFRLTLSVLASQFLFHTLFVVGTPYGASPPPLVNAHALHGAPIEWASTLVPLSHGAHSGAGMWLAHGIAALITVVVIHRAEVLFTAISAVKEFVLAQLAPEVLVVDTTLVRNAHTVVRKEPPFLHPLGVYPSTTTLRGPPTPVFH